jgi:hypothetical protein
MGRCFQPFFTKKGVYETGPDGKPMLYQTGPRQGQPKPKRFFVEDWYIEYTNIAGKTVRRKAGAIEEEAKNALNVAERDVLDARNGVTSMRPAEVRLSDLVDLEGVSKPPPSTWAVPRKGMGF